MSSVARVALPLSLLIAVFGCKENTITTNEDNDFIAQTIGAMGGDLELDGAKVHVPADALSDDVELRLGRVSSGYPPFPMGLSPIGGVFALEPREVTFANAATLSVNASKGSMYIADSRQWMMLPSQLGGGMVAAESLTGGFFAALDGGGKVVDGGSGMGTGGSPGGPGGTMGDGTLVRGGLAPMAQFWAMGENYVFSFDEGMDAFGAMTRFISAAALDSEDPPVTVKDFGSTNTMISAITAIGDEVYWGEDDPAGNPPGMKLYRCAVGGAPEPITTVAGQGMGGFRVSNGQLLFVNTSNQLQIFDPAAGMVDPTEYGKPAMGGGPFMNSTYAMSQDHVFLVEGGSGSDFQIWTAEPGSPATDAGITFPGGAQIVAVGATGTTFVLVTATMTQQNVLTYDTTMPGAMPKTIASITANSSGAGSDTIVIEGDELFTTTFDQGSVGDVLKISLPDGEQTKLGSYQAAGFQRSPKVNSTGVYVLQNSNNGGELYKWAR